jgi:hypothetical protein
VVIKLADTNGNQTSENKPAKGGETTTGGQENTGTVQISKEEYEGLKTKVGELGETIGGYKDFIDGASVVINTLAYTPELRTAFQESLKKQYGVGQQQTQGDKAQTTATGDQKSTPTVTDDVNRKLEDVTGSQRLQIVESFEKEYAISSLDKEERKQTRQAIEAYLNDFGWSLKTAPLSALKGALEKAYVGTRAEKLKEQGKLEGVAQFRQNQMGAFGTMSGGAPSSDESGELTPAQKEWAEKFNLDLGKVKETYKNRVLEEKRIPKSEKPS